MENTAFNWAIVQDLLENIKEIEGLIAMHQKGDSSPLIVFQYEEKKDRFIAELNAAIHPYFDLTIKKRTKRTLVPKLSRKTARVEKMS